MKYQFKTNIKCSGCVAKVAPFLNTSDEIAAWEVDLQHPDRVLTVETDEFSVEDIHELVKQAGYQAEPIATETVS